VLNLVYDLLFRDSMRSICRMHMSLRPVDECLMREVDLDEI